MKTLPMRALALASLMGLAAGAHADNISLRFSFGGATAGVQPIHAERGTFALSPDLPAHAEGETWRVVVRDKAGAVLHQRAIKNPRLRHVETWDRHTGAIDQTRTVQEASGAFEITVPFGKEVASVEVEGAAQASGRVSRLGDVAAMGTNQTSARFERSKLEQLLVQAQSMRATAAALDGTGSVSAMATPTAQTVHYSGPAAQRMDYVFIGDGYTAAEMDKWRADAQKVINGFLADPLFAANKNSMNIHRVDIASNQTGVDEPDRGIYKDTAMDGTFYCYNIDRLLCVNETKVFNIAGQVLAPDSRDVIIVVSNSTRYGGSGGRVGTLSMHASATEIALHEIGHTAFKLADEYDYGTCSLGSEPTEQNVSRVGTRAVKWGSYIGANTPVPTQPGQYANGTVGAFQGAQYCSSGKYRPTENSRMRTLGYPWHVVNENLVKKVFAQYGGTTPGGVVQTGALSAGGTAYVPSASPGYKQGGAGTYRLTLTGPTGANFNLYLYKWNGSAWSVVASSTGATSSEAINYNGTAGYYYAAVYSASGSGTYTVNYSFPAP